MMPPTTGRPLVAVVTILLMAGSAIAQQRWYDLYDQAIDHIQRGQYTEAEAELLQAKKLGPPPGRSVLRYGMMRKHFFPDFFLGVVDLNTSRPTEALRQFALARAQKINDNDREFQTIAAMEEQARVDEKRFAAANAIAKAPIVPAVADPKPVPPPTPDPGPAAGGGEKERDQKRDAAERDAMKLFFAGDYKQSVTVLETAERDLNTRLTSRGYLYRACALAAQALQSSVVDARMLEDARRHYADVHDAQAPLPDRRYISPKILKTLGS